MKKTLGIITALAFVAVFAGFGCEQKGQQGGQTAPGSAPTTTTAPAAPGAPGGK